VHNLPSKDEALSSNPSTTKKIKTTTRKVHKRTKHHCCWILKPPLHLYTAIFISGIFFHASDHALPFLVLVLLMLIHVYANSDNMYEYKMHPYFRDARM
jgi:hypothetical protein